MSNKIFSTKTDETLEGRLFFYHLLDGETESGGEVICHGLPARAGSLVSLLGQIKNPKLTRGAWEV